MKNTGLLVLLSLASCSNASDAHDAAVPGDLAVARDLGPGRDFADHPPGSDLSTGPGDMSLAGGDLARTGDLVMTSDAGPFICYDPGSSFGTFDRGCQIDGDCAWGLHQIDCCRSEAALGFSQAMAKNFTTAEADFRVICPANCKCAARPTKCDDGSTTVDPKTIRVSCDKGQCTTHGQ